MRRSLDLVNWDVAQEQVRDWESKRSFDENFVKIPDAVKDFLDDCSARMIQPGTLKNLRIVLDDVQEFANRQGFTLLRQLDLEALRKLRGSWTFSPITQQKKLERLRAFFRFCTESGWIEKNPAANVKPPKVTQSPTLPFTEKEEKALLEACDKLPDNYGKVGGANAHRMRALLLLLRYSGLRIGDAISLRRERIQAGKVHLRTAKTGTVVSVPLPKVALDALKAVENKNPDYFFWSGVGNLEGNRLAHATDKWRDRFANLSKLAGVEGAHFHRWRDTFATRILEKGVPIETVAVLLGHNSIRVTEKSYSAWVSSRQLVLEDAVRKTWK